MRGALAGLGLLLVAGGLVLAFRERPPEPPELGTPGAPLASTSPGPEDGIVRREIGTLIVRVSTESGELPPGTEIGYEALHREVWAYAGKEGTRAFTNVPVGIVYAQAKAPGYALVRQRRDLPPGVADEALLVLRRAETGDPPER